MNFIIASKYNARAAGERSWVMPGFWMMDPLKEGSDVYPEAFKKGDIWLVPEGHEQVKPGCSPVGILENLKVFSGDDYIFSPDERAKISEELIPEGSVKPFFSYKDEVGLCWHTTFNSTEEASKAFLKYLEGGEASMTGPDLEGVWTYRGRSFRHIVAHSEYRCGSYCIEVLGPFESPKQAFEACMAYQPKYGRGDGSGCRFYPAKQGVEPGILFKGPWTKDMPDPPKVEGEDCVLNGLKAAW